MRQVLKNDTSRVGIAQEHGAPKLLVQGAGRNRRGGQSESHARWRLCFFSEVRMSQKTFCCVATLLISALAAPVGLAASDYPAGGAGYIGGSIGNFSYKTGDQE